MASLQPGSILPAAEGILTTDLYAKVSSAEVAGGRIVGIAKGAGMIEPNMATMLAYVLTDIDLPRELLRELLAEVVDGSFNSISVDSDQSTSDTLAMISSGKVPFGGSDAEVAEVRAALADVCADLSELIVRNGEGCNHLIKVVVTGGANAAEAKGVGKAVVNSPLFKCAVAGNDPNVGRLASSIGDYIGSECGGGMDSLANCEISMGGRVLCANGEFVLDHETEEYLMKHMKDAEQVQAAADDGAPPRLLLSLSTRGHVTQDSGRRCSPRPLPHKRTFFLAPLLAVYRSTGCGHVTTSAAPADLLCLSGGAFVWRPLSRCRGLPGLPAPPACGGD